MRAAFLTWFCASCIIPATAQEILVSPYIQPGNASGFAKEQKVILWQTDSLPGNFAVSYQLKGDEKKRKAKISAVELKLKLFWSSVIALLPERAKPVFTKVRTLPLVVLVVKSQRSRLSSPIILLV